MKLHHAAALALTGCVLTILSGPHSMRADYLEPGFPTKAACEARLKARRPSKGWGAVKAYCDCPDEPHSPKTTPAPRGEITPVPDNE